MFLDMYDFACVCLRVWVHFVVYICQSLVVPGDVSVTVCLYVGRCLLCCHVLICLHVSAKFANAMDIGCACVGVCVCESRCQVSWRHFMFVHVCGCMHDYHYHVCACKSNVRMHMCTCLNINRCAALEGYGRYISNCNMSMQGADMGRHK